jgi:membrane protein DedA with SNARE-associated domain
MIESLFSFICSYSDQAHWIIFILLLLAGLNVPISSDILLLTGGALAGTCEIHHAARLYGWMLIGYYLAAWEGYWMGRLLGPTLFQIRFFKHLLNPQRIQSLNLYYERYGLLTFLIGRFLPGGIRNALSLSSGLIRMPFWLFVFRDSLASTLSCTFLFFLGYKFGENFDLVLYYFQRYSNIFVILSIISSILILGYSIYRYGSRSKTSSI